MSVTLKDVSKLAGVSLATASLVLNNQKGVSEKSRLKVLDAAQKLGYRPNILARSLIKGKTNTVLLCAFIKEQGKLSAFYGELINSLLTAVSYQEFYLQMVVKGEFYNGHPLDKRTAFLDIAHNRLFEGLIILSHWPISYSEVGDLVKENFPFVIVNQKVDGEGVSYIDIDHYGGTKEAINYLIKKGHRRIAHIRGPMDHLHAQERYRAYVDTLLENEISLKKEYIIEGNFRRLSGRTAMERLLEKKPYPTAIYAANDKMAIGALQAAKENGLNVPQDLDIVGFDGIEAVKYTDPPLPTVEQPLEELGKLAATMLIENIKGGDRRKVILPCRLDTWDNLNQKT
ncbi:LacI family DNA-binding transcriptional regulator [Atribacter laminatus]|jgi:DNA-binding LacI/PurR family transcriptional regulator|uniref:Putative HTH-type transcriptional repressor ExuR n=1 Tax=Atribacter laminatus TaxID=2847778 RepID=A0A7T1F342_ATRLM|nr:LacI family DNA-binding transcriptional regulator [Atribacter laminatus]QPM68708.1 putative HTH-type transcriptional repressor ExuR [Atribacter laminatus]